MSEQKFSLATVVRCNWNCTTTINYVGKKGAISAKELRSQSDVKTVLIGKEAVNFHIKELQIKD